MVGDSYVDVIGLVCSRSSVENEIGHFKPLYLSLYCVPRSASGVPDTH